MKIKVNQNSFIIKFLILFFYFYIPNLSQGYNSNITVKVKGNGTLYFLSNYFEGENISELYLNGVKQNEIVNHITSETDQEYEIILVWHIPVTTCKSMFYYINNLTEIDLSNFDASKVTSIYNMFYRCPSLTSINLSNLNAPILTIVSLIFDGKPNVKL